jgi:hypothetical protein
VSELKEAVRPYGIAIDYDDTFSTCPETWGKVIDVLRAAGAHVFCVTFRTPDRVVTDFPGEVFYTAGRQKWEYMHDQQVDVHIWIDDQPALIGENPYRVAFMAGLAAARASADGR